MNNIIKNAIYIIAIISISLSMCFAINISLAELTEEELMNQRFLLTALVLISLTCWIITMINNQTKNKTK
jgi:NADH:ubiquinone oxidoreductase subunit 6 (subunit J)